MKKDPVKIFSDDPNLKCAKCGKNLLSEAKGNYIVFEEDDGFPSRKVKLLYACKEHDHNVTLEERLKGCKDAGWDDIEDLKIPTIWLMKLMAFFNEVYNDHEHIDATYFDQVKKMFINTFPYVCRDMDEDERTRLRNLLEFNIL